MRSRFALPVATCVLSLLLGSAVSAQKIRYDSVPGTDFSRYKTYKWQRADKAIYPSEENDKMLIRAIDAELALRGLTRTEAEEADIYVIYQLAILDNFELSSFRTEVGWATGASTMPGIRAGTTNSATPIKSGSLILDIYDVAQKKRVWQAYATKSVDPDAEFSKREKNTRKVMAKIMKGYPSVGK